MNERQVRGQQQGNTMMVQELAQAKAQVKKLEALVQELRGKPVEAPKAPPPPKTRDLVLASNKALREALALLKRVDAKMRECFSPLYLGSPEGTDEAFVLLVKDIPAFLALDLDKTVVPAVVPAKVVRKGPEVTVVGRQPSQPVVVQQKPSPFRRHPPEIE